MRDEREVFWMRDEHKGRSQEIVEHGFWLADTPCTQAFWQAVTGENPSHFKQGGDAPERPVECVSWDNVQKQFIARFAATPDWGTGNGLCLPTEAEWEYAARAGTRTAYWWGEEWDAAHGNVNVTGMLWSGYKEGTTPVKRYTPNPWGLYDVHGNVWEWCADVWRPHLDVPEAQPDEDGRVVRGSSWIPFPGHARPAFRLRRLRRHASRNYGFRFALRSPRGPER
jgi:formylglycine-generating enzyme required for sulfatase activity